MTVGIITIIGWLFAALGAVCFIMFGVASCEEHRSQRVEAVILGGACTLLCTGLTLVGVTP
jgi:hypothetical protein